MYLSKLVKPIWAVTNNRLDKQNSFGLDFGEPWPEHDGIYLTPAVVLVLLQVLRRGGGQGHEAERALLHPQTGNLRVLLHHVEADARPEVPWLGLGSRPGLYFEFPANFLHVYCYGFRLVFTEKRPQDFTRYSFLVNLSLLFGPETGFLLRLQEAAEVSRAKNPTTERPKAALSLLLVAIFWPFLMHRTEEIAAFIGLLFSWRQHQARNSEPRC